MSKSKLDEASTIAIRECMGTKTNESILIITDENKREIGYSLYRTALNLGHESILIEMRSRAINGEDNALCKKFK